MFFTIILQKTILYVQQATAILLYQHVSCFSPVSFDSYWDQSLEVSPMCLSASQTLAHKIKCVSRRRRVFFSVVCRRVSYSHYVLIRRLSKAFVTMATGQWTRHRVCRQLRTSPSHLTCLCALPLGLMGKLHSEALPHTPHPTPPPPFPTALRYKPQSL